MADAAQGPGQERETTPSAIPNPQLDVEDQEQDLAKINEIISRPGVRETLQRFDEQFQHQPGTIAVYGIRSDGLVVGVRHSFDKSSESNTPRDMFGYYEAWAVDANLPVEQIESEIIHARIPFNYAMAMRNGDFELGSSLQELAELSEEDLRSKVPEDSDMANAVKFQKKTGGVTRGATYDMFSHAQLDPKPSAGGQRLYSLNLK